MPIQSRLETAQVIALREYFQNVANRYLQEGIAVTYEVMAMTGYRIRVIGNSHTRGQDKPATKRNQPETTILIQMCLMSRCVILHTTRVILFGYNPPTHIRYCNLTRV